jgi:hypothetical protein
MMPYLPTPAVKSLFIGLKEEMEICKGKWSFAEFADGVKEFYSKVIWGTEWAIAKAKVNSTFLAEYLRKLNLIQEAEKSGKLEVFEPFIDPNIFCNDKNVIKKKQIFVYARPEVRRNRFDLCVGALNLALKKIPKDWEIIGLGTLKKDWPLKNGRKIRAGSKLEFHNYVKFLKETPLSLCLMESPHPSHPPLEHAASGGVVVCNRFSVKDYSKLGPQYICSDLDAKSLANALELAVLKLDENLCFTA